MIKVLNRLHNIISIDQEDIPEHLKNHTLIVYLPEKDMIVLAGWGSAQIRLAELIATYMGLTLRDHKKALEFLEYMESPYTVLEILRTLSEIYQIRQHTLRVEAWAKPEIICFWAVNRPEVRSGAHNIGS